MAVQITIRNVPEAIRDELAVRAALERKSMQEYLRGELERLASHPTPAQWLESVRQRKATMSTRVRPEKILRHRDPDRR